jgi:alkanesulfonate monooxygenase SsuD/methylene tetrahydromethanopterin reductase-like flavin-dependent oxidoreductase (luciferase family)
MTSDPEKGQPQKRLRFGLSLDTSSSVAVEAAAAERLGFDYLASGEHLFFHGATPNAFVTLAAAAGVTRRIRLVSTISLLPLYPAPLAAKLIASLDQVSGGRFEYGAGAGGEFPAEFAAAGVPLASRFRRLDEALEVIRLLSAGGIVEFAGEFTQLSGVALDPVPVQRPVPLWLGGRKEGAIRRAARFADVWMPYMVTPDRFAASLAAVREEAQRHDRPAEAISGALFAWMCVGQERGWARHEGIAAASRTYRQDFSALADRYLLLGTPDDVAIRLAEYADAGVERVIVKVAAAPADRDRVIATVAGDLMPRLSSAG